jgi:cell wall-associated NlpC family hydrolase
MPVPIWAGRYIGLPFKDHGRDRAGLDCWGLARLALAEQYSIALPSYCTEYRRTVDVTRIAALMERELKKWQPVKDSDAHPGDLIILRMHGQPMHVGLVLGDRQMLHIESGINSSIESYAASRWRDRIHGFYRHVRFNDYFSDRNDDDATDDIFGF